MESSKFTLLEKGKVVLVSNPDHELVGKRVRVLTNTQRAESSFQVEDLAGEQHWVLLSDVKPIQSPATVFVSGMTDNLAESFSLQLENLANKVEQELSFRQTRLGKFLDAKKGTPQFALGVFFVAVLLLSAPYFNAIGEYFNFPPIFRWLPFFVFIGVFLLLLNLMLIPELIINQKKRTLWLSEVRDFLPQTARQQHWDEGQIGAVVEQIQRIWPTYTFQPAAEITSLFVDEAPTTREEPETQPEKSLIRLD